MSISLSQVAVPTFVQLLNSLTNLLDKAATHATAKQIDPAVLVNYRLAPDMFPLAQQIQIATNQAKGAIARLAGVEVPSYADTETTFDELKARIARTLDFVNAFTDDQIDGTEEREIVLKREDKELRLTGQNYLLHLVFPHFYFHVATTYAILRHAGVDLGKRDFLGQIPGVTL
ncbi:hypothetical protein GCM10011611_51320 [Aliidongia dinghuensis]|uniref:DUF1993 domain-containing protein n=2 Tax=Aliidongia dinghuensis TaxID=1867774 RepID=A0A8J3E5W5_9PROT|nr:hypothetical protein GCM10011611_51320 [Aliidongia dinghuensis]